MKYWQKARNYRKYEREDGMFVYLITVNGEDVEVSAEVYRAYSQADRRERYQAERDENVLLSLERFAEDEMHLSYLTGRHNESAEDAAFRDVLPGQAMLAFGCLAPEEQHLIRALIVDGVTERDYAAVLGISQVAVHKRKQRILGKIQNILDFPVISTP
jgi:DNA-directed RNA polymerase specialized sigma24 family protein